MKKTFLLAVSLMQVLCSQQFNTYVVKRYDHKNDLIGPWGPYQVFDCYLGPSRLQFNCKGSVARLVAESLALLPVQFDEKKGPEYVVTATFDAPVPRETLDMMLAKLLKDHMEVRYHFEKRQVKGQFLTVVDQALLCKLPVVNTPLPLANIPNYKVRHGRWLGFAERSWPTQDVEEVRLRNINFGILAETLQIYYMTPFINSTGLKQRFDFTMLVRYDLSEPGPPHNLAEVKKALAQYGIAIQTRSELIDFLVIDAVGAESKFLD